MQIRPWKAHFALLADSTLLLCNSRWRAQDRQGAGWGPEAEALPTPHPPALPALAGSPHHRRLSLICQVGTPPAPPRPAMFVVTMKGMQLRVGGGKGASYPSSGSCRSGSWIPKEPRIASTSGWYSKIILRKPCRNGIAAAAPSAEAETPTGHVPGAAVSARLGHCWSSPLAGPLHRPNSCSAPEVTLALPARSGPGKRAGDDSALCGLGGPRRDWARQLGVSAGRPWGTGGRGPAAQPDRSPWRARPLPARPGSALRSRPRPLGAVRAPPIERAHRPDPCPTPSRGGGDSNPRRPRAALDSGRTTAGPGSLLAPR